MDIAYCVNDRYVPYITVSARSAAESHPARRLTIHVLSDDITLASRRRLTDELAGFPLVTVKFYDVDDSALDGLEAWSKYTWYRLLLQDNLPRDVHRVLYLDADTLVCDDLSGIFDADMDGVAVAGVVDPMTFDDEAFRRCGYPRSKGYLCAGVLMLNLDFWRANDLSHKMIVWGLQHVDIRFHDQDVINHVCQDCKAQLPLRYGVVDSLFCKDEVFRPPYIDQVEDCMNTPAIIHYAGTAPWLKDAVVHPLDHRWHEVNQRLRRPVKKSFRSKGLLLLKVMLWNLVHPGYKRRRVTKEGVLARIRNS